MPYIRPLAICVFYKGGCILAERCVDNHKNEVFYRPLGGGVEFGEYGVDALQRELDEEIGASAADVEFVGFIENIYTYEGRPGHELAMVYKGRIADESFYDKEKITVRVDEHTKGEAFWVPVNDFKSGDRILYPSGLAEMLPMPGE